MVALGCVGIQDGLWVRLLCSTDTQPRLGIAEKDLARNGDLFLYLELQGRSYLCMMS